jgi:cytochrome c oxidase subunit 4
MKAFFEDPALLVGLPLLLLGLFGLGMAGLSLVAPQPGGAVAVRHAAHPGPEEYVKVGMTLAAITAVEVAIYYVSIPRTLFICMLIALSLSKFMIVVLWFMHLKFDSRLFSIAFATGLIAASAVFTVVLVTLGANLV